LKKTLIVTLILLLLASSLALAQKRKRSTGATRQRSVAQPTPTPGFRAEAMAVAEQIKVFSRFLYLYGRISNGLETADYQEKRGELSGALSDQNKQNKLKVAEKIGEMRGGLDKVVTLFQNNSRLQLQSSLLISAAEDAAAAQQSATAGNFDEAGRYLVKVSEKLTEVLAELR